MTCPRFVIAILALLFVGCQGVITKHNYTASEINDIAKFAGTSQENVRKYLSGNATISDVGNSALRIDNAVKYIKAKQAP